MNKNYIYGIIAVIIIVGILIGIKLGGNLTGGNQSGQPGGDQIDQIDQISGDTEINGVTSIPIEPTLTSAPTPTFAPISDTIKSISDDKIIATGAGGDMTLPKNAEMISVFIQRGDDLVPATFEDVKVGQNVIIKIITPGKKAELIIIP